MVLLIDEDVDGLVEVTHGSIEQAHMLVGKAQGCVEQM